MAEFNMPYTDYHRLNLDWIISEIQKIPENALTQDNIVQILGTASDKVLSQKAATESIEGKVSKLPVNITFTVRADNTVSLGATFNDIKSSINGRSGKLIMNGGKADNSLLTPTYMSDESIGLTHIFSADNKTVIIEEIEIKNGENVGTYDAIPIIIPRITNIYFYSPNNDSNYICNKTYAEIAEKIRDVSIRYRFFNGDLQKQNCEIFLNRFAAGVNQIYFEGVYSSNTITDIQGRNIKNSTIVRVTYGSNNIVSVLFNTTGVDDSQDSTKTSTTYSPSNRYVNENFVEYADLENNLIYADPEKAPSMDLISQNFAPIDFTKAELALDNVISDVTGINRTLMTFTQFPANTIRAEFDIAFIGGGDFSNISLKLIYGNVAESTAITVYNNTYVAHVCVQLHNSTIPTTPATNGYALSYKLMGTNSYAEGFLQTPVTVNVGINESLSLKYISPDSLSLRFIAYNIRYWTE